MGDLSKRILKLMLQFLDITDTPRTNVQVQTYDNSGVGPSSAPTLEELA
jgi:hypothetical protein